MSLKTGPKDCLCYLFFALQLFAEQLLLCDMQAPLQTFHLLLQRLGGKEEDTVSSSV